MSKQKPLGLINLAFNLIQAYVNRFVTLTHLAGLEARLAGRTLVTIIILVFVLLIFIVCTWFSLEAWLFFFLISHNLSLLWSSFILVMLNLVILISIVLYMLHIKKRLFFPATRQHLSQMQFIKRRRK